MDDRFTIQDPWLRRPLPLFGQLDAAGYAELGFMCGLEVHQQLLTERKLFCRCPAGRYANAEHHAEVLRHMRPTLSEMGEYDGTALMEFKTRKEIVYLLNNETVCTYEMDDAPPFEIDDVALDRAIAITMMLGCNVVGEVHITRKQYLDGSIPTGFQRTAIIGTDGDIPFAGRNVHIRQLSIEEDSCREVSDRGHVRTYRTDRLGMPLIEMVTDPDMKTPAEAMQVGQVIRWLCRASGLVRTGSGAARQDVNVSVTGGTRIEIKGVPSLRMIPRLIHNEALRQRSLVGIRGELQRRGISADKIADRGFDVTAAVRGTGCRFIRRAVEKGATVLAIPLPGFQGLLEVQTQPRTSFLKEFSDRIRVIACIDELPNLALSTQDVPTLSSGEWDRVAKTCGVGPDVPVIVVWGSGDDAATAVREVAIRAREATVGVPNETRQALDDGTNGFERILPGADRMYPDTDLPPIALDDPRVDALRRGPAQPALGARGPGPRPGRGHRPGRAPGPPPLLGPVRPPGAAPGRRPGDRRAAGLPAAGPLLPPSGQPGRRRALVGGRGGPPGRRRAHPRRRVERRRGTPGPAGASPWPGSACTRSWPTLPADLPADRRKRELLAMGAVMPALRGRVPGARVRAWLKEELA